MTRHEKNITVSLAVITFLLGAIIGSIFQLFWMRSIYPEIKPRKEKSSMAEKVKVLMYCKVGTDWQGHVWNCAN